MRFIRIFLLLAATIPALVHATTAMFYQPQLRDRTVPAQQWPQIFAATQAYGFNTLVVQWTAFGNAFTNEAERTWLDQTLHQANAAKLQLILGLTSDPDVVNRLRQPGEALDHYLLQLSRKNLEQARQWLARLGPDAIAGWYLPLEIDDVVWRDAAARDSLKRYLAREARQLRALHPRPIYISAFFAGNMTPNNYTQMLKAVTADSGIRLWVQDGRGSKKLSEAERQLYLDAVTDCQAPAAQGIVYELFQQLGDQAGFSAQPLDPKAAHARLKRHAPCNGDSVFFSLRYLPTISTTLQH